MRPAFWIACGAAFFCLVSVHCQDIFSENTLDGGEFENGDRDVKLDDHAFRYMQNTEGDNEAPCENFCKNGGTCKVENDQAKCTCTDQFSGDNCENDECEKCGKEPDVTCDYDDDEKKFKCSCEDERIFDKNRRECRKACEPNSEDCQNGATCQSSGTLHFCNCKKGTKGDFCDVPDCGKDNCGKDDDAECEYNKDKSIAECKCKDDEKVFDEEDKVCRKKCKEGDKCGENGVCANGVCKCKDGYRGSNCDEVTECDQKLKEVCATADADCVYDETEKKATCRCKDGNFYFTNRKCVAKFCKNKVCGPDSECVFNKTIEAGVCNCRDNSKYHDYKIRGVCKDPDTCILRNESCGKNEECKGGKCQCLPNFKRDENKDCKPDFCKNKPCFYGGECDDSDGYVKCTCKEGYYFDGSSCKGRKCSLGEDFKKNCTCPTDMERTGQETECVPKEGYEVCDKDCGYGYCIKREGKDETRCNCFGDFSEPTKGSTKCVLKNTFCPNRLLMQDFSRCNCTGKYKQAADGKTCELLTCSDKIVQDKCKKQGAECIMDWKKKTFQCQCPKGYQLDMVKGVCTDPCSMDKLRNKCHETDQICYNTITTTNRATSYCKCPPPLQMDSGGCFGLGENFYITENLRVLKKRYLMDEDKINHLLLNSDIMLSMQQTFIHYTFGNLLDYREEDDVLICKVWVELKENSADDINRIAGQVRSFECDNCDSNLKLWPPNLLLSGEVAYHKLYFCSNATKNNLCGKDAICENNTCSCGEGFKMTEYPLRKMGSKFRIQRCEDIDECATLTHECTVNTTCVNTAGGYYCECKSGYKKKGDSLLTSAVKNTEACFDLCTPNPCKKGSCLVKKEGFDCNCDLGYAGSFCDKADERLASAKKSAVVTGAVLGTLLGIVLIAFFLFWRKMKGSSYSGDFTPAPRSIHAAEMMERRPVRGVINQSYE